MFPFDQTESCSTALTHRLQEEIEGLSQPRLEWLHAESQWQLHLIEAELMRRQDEEPPHTGLEPFSEIVSSINTCVGQIKSKSLLSYRYTVALNQTNTDFHLFTRKLSRHLGSAYGKLLICSLGRYKIGRLTNENQLRLLKYFVRNRSALYCQQLDQNPMPSTNSQKHEILSLDCRRDSEASFVVLQPCSLPVRRFEQLDNECKDLAALLAHLGGVDIPYTLLKRAVRGSPRWNRSGEIEFPNPTPLMPALSSIAHFNRALHSLLQSSIVSIKPECVLHGSLTLDQSVRTAASAFNFSRLPSVKFISCIFPQDRYLDPFFYSEFGTLALPMLQYITNWLREPGTWFDFNMGRDEIDLLAATYLSASRFSTLDWKTQCITMIRQLLQSRSADDLLRKKLNHRENEIASLYATYDYKASARGLNSSSIDPIHNAFYGEVVLWSAQQEINTGSLQAAWDTLTKFGASSINSISTQEQLVFYRIDLLRSRLLRFEGRFREAQRELRKLQPSARKYAALQPFTDTEIVRVSCELGDFRLARQCLMDEIGESSWLRHGKGLRHRLLSAQLSFSQCLWNARERQHGEQQTKLIFETEAQLASLSETYVCRIELNRVAERNLFSVRFGQAAIAHLQSKWNDALSYWEKMTQMMDKLEWKQGYVRMIVAYSTYHALQSTGDSMKAATFYHLGKTLSAEYSRQHFFVGLGSLWPDVLGGMIGEEL